MKRKETVSLVDGANTQMLYFTSSSLSADDERIYLISDRDGHANVYVRDLRTGAERQLTHNTQGIMRSYVYFDGVKGEGFGKASVCLDAKRDLVYFIQNDEICRVGLDGQTHVLHRIANDQMTAFTHVSADGRYLCVPTTDARILDFDPDTEGYGLDKRPKYDIDARVQREGLQSYLRVYDTETGEEVLCERVPKCWITHVQFHPLDSRLILYNHEWPSFDCGTRRMQLFDGKNHTPLRTQGEGRSRDDWVCHEMWSSDGRYVIYHGAYEGGAAFVGRVEVKHKTYSEIALPKEYDAYGHFTCEPGGDLVCDGYYRQPGEAAVQRENSTDNGPDPHKKNAEYISRIHPDWQKRTLRWTPLCKHGTDWLGQDAHPHAIFNHRADRIYFSARINGYVGVYAVDAL